MVVCVSFLLITMLPQQKKLMDAERKVCVHFSGLPPKTLLNWQACFLGSLQIKWPIH